MGISVKAIFVSPPIVDRLPLDHPLWKKEMFLPIVTVAGVENLEEAMRQANAGGLRFDGRLLSSSPKKSSGF